MAEVKQEQANGGSHWEEEKAKALANSQITNSSDRRLKEARIFVGNLPADLRTEKGDLFDKFRKHGPIIGVSVHGRFAFVQFQSEADAKAACKAESGTELRSAFLEVKMVLEGGRPVGREDRDRGGERRRSRSPVNRRRGDSRDRRDRSRSRSRDRMRPSRDRRDSRARSPASSYVPSAVEERFCHPRSYGANDVELVVIRKTQGEYADSILRRFYDRRMSANMLFLAEHASLDAAVNEFGRCGSRYVVTVMPKHEETRAITINIFEADGPPREVRNINVDEGVSLVYRHFRDHFPALARLREMEIQGPGFYPPAPAEVARVFSRMLETSAVPTSSLDAAIRYLQDMRDRTAIAEGILPHPAVAAPTNMPYRPEPEIGKPAYPSEESIRDSVLGLLKATGMAGNAAASAYPSVGAVGGAPMASQYPAGALGAVLSNPDITKTLESLSGLLKQTGAASAPMASTTQASASVPAYRTVHETKSEENGYSGQSNQPGNAYSAQSNQQVNAYSAQGGQQQVSYGSTAQRPSSGSNAYGVAAQGVSQGQPSYGSYGGGQQQQQQQQQSAVGGYNRGVSMQSYGQSNGQVSSSAPPAYTGYGMQQRQQVPNQASQQSYSTQRR